jgi:acyl-CoA synthetase (AMP-forming)/AMP-acid ligase II/acyl carrier protein
MLIERLSERAAEAPRQACITWIDDRGRDERTLDFGTLLERVKTLSGFLRGPAGLAPGDRALLVHPPSLAFVEAFAACLYAGVIPVPCYPPDPRDRDDVARVGAVAAEAGARVALTSGQFRWAQRLASVATLLSSSRPAWPDLAWHVTDTVATGAFPAARHASAPGDVAFLQFTSGSTSAPRGVALTFANLQHQLDLNSRVLGLGPSSRAVLWVPQYHDLGLVSGMCSALHGNGHLFMMSPLTFLSRPALWADVITRTRATHTASPHFGYALLLRKTTAAERARYDFSHLEVMMSAGEPIHQETMERFFDAFAPSGLRREAWCPAYGLAEHTVGVTMGGRRVLSADRAVLERTAAYQPASDAAPGRGVATLVGCGRAEGDVVVKIVDPDTRHVKPEGVVGEIWVDSPSKAPAYFGKPEDTERLLAARIDGDSSERRYLRTGDLGLVVDGELFVTGRIKDLIIVGGRNLAAIDVEAAVREASLAIRPGGIAAIGVHDAASDSEAVALVLESTAARIEGAAARAIADAARAAVMESLRVPVTAVIVGVAGLVPKTTSGKPQRRACRDALASGALERSEGFRFRFGYDAVDASAREALAAPTVELRRLPERVRDLPIHERLDAVTAALQEAVARTLGRDDPHAIDPRAPFGSLGLDSMSLVDLADSLSELAEAPLALALLAALPDLESVAAYLLRDVLHVPFVEAAKPGAEATHRPSRVHRRTWDPPRDARIAIVGGGCAGLVSAMELGRRGHRDVTLFEARADVGGKVVTVDEDGVSFELGQVAFCRRYREIWRLALDTGCTFEPEPGLDLLVDASGEHTELRTTHASRSWYDAVFAAAGIDVREPPAASFDDIPEEQLAPTSEWLAAHGLPMPPTSFLATWTGCGYGYVTDRVPAWYALRYVNVVDSGAMLPVTIQGGNRRLWERVAETVRERFGHAIRLGAPVRGYEATDDGVWLTTAGGERERFDAVIFALPVHALAPMLPEAVRDPFLRFRHYGYRAAAIDLEGIGEQVRAIQFPEALEADRGGGLLGLVRAHGAPRSFVAGQYFELPGGEALSDAVLDARLDEQLGRLGARVLARRRAARWSHYFPHLSAEDLARGTLGEIEAMQGRQRTYFVGSYLGLETLEHTARHAQAIVRTFF